MIYESLWLPTNWNFSAVEQNFYVLASTEFQIREFGGGMSSILVSDQGDYTFLNYIKMCTTMFFKHSH